LGAGLPPFFLSRSAILGNENRMAAGPHPYIEPLHPVLSDGFRKMTVV
jgi:hypothetical protein